MRTPGSGCAAKLLSRRKEGRLVAFEVVVFTSGKLARAGADAVSKFTTKESDSVGFHRDTHPTFSPPLGGCG